MSKHAISLLARVRTSLRVRAALRADEVTAATILARLPRFEGQTPMPRPHGTVFASCDDPYFRRYGLHLARSALRFSPDQGCHLHLVNPGADVLTALETLKTEPGGDRLSYSFERTATAADPVQAARARYLMCTRFVRVWQVLEASRAPVIALDADSLIRRPLTPVVHECGHADIGLFIRAGRTAVARRVLAAVLVAMPTDLGRRFMRDNAVALADAAHHGTHLATDQLVLYMLWRAYQRREPAFAVAHLGRKHSDWRYDGGSYVWHAKGGRKSLAGAFADLARGAPLEAVLGASGPTSARLCAGHGAGYPHKEHRRCDQRLPL